MITRAITAFLVIFTFTVSIWSWPFGPLSDTYITTTTTSKEYK